MLITSLKVNGIGPFSKEISFGPAKLDSIISITGQNGVGKTFLLECIPAALYDCLPFRTEGRKKTVFDYCQRPGKSTIELEFTMPDGAHYRIERTYTIRGEWHGDTFNHKAAEQQARFSILNGDIYDPIATSVSGVLEEVEKRICSKAIFLAGVFNSQNSAGDLVKCSPDERKQIFASLIGLSPLQARADFFSQRVKLIEELRYSETSKLSAIERDIHENPELLKANIFDAENSVKELTAKRDALSTQIESAITAETEQKERARSYNAKSSELADLKRQFDKFAQWKYEAQQKVANVPELIKKREALAAYKQQAVTLRDQCAGATSIQEAITDLNKRMAELDSKRRDATDIISTAERHALNAKLLDSLDCPANCQYVANARAGRDWLDSNPGIISAKKEEIIFIDKQIAAFAGQKRAELEKLQGFNDLKSKLSGVEDIINRGESLNFNGQIATAEAAQTEIISLDERIKDISDKRDALEAELSAMEAPAPIESSSITFKRELEQTNLSLNNRIREQAELQVRLEHHEQAEKDALAVRASIAGLELLHEAYTKLSIAFSRNGIQALIIDCEKQDFLGISRDLFNILSGGKMQLMFSTQKTLKSGEKREGFDLLVSVGGIVRDILDCSQGQQDLARVVMRATLGIYYSMRGSRIQSYFLDETTGSLDDVNREAYLEFIKYLLTPFKQIFVISHQDIARAISCRVVIEKGQLWVA